MIGSQTGGDAEFGIGSKNPGTSNVPVKQSACAVRSRNSSQSLAAGVEKLALRVAEIGKAEFVD